MQKQTSKKILAFFTIFFLSLQTFAGLELLFPQQAKAAGTTYYVDNCDVTGNDTNNGTGPATPWLTINKVNTGSFNPGDSILFRRGCTWREQLVVSSSGSAGKPITFGAYGTGPDPIFDGSDVVAGWSVLTDAPNKWKATVTTEPRVVLISKTRGTKKSSIGNLTTANDWYWSANKLYFYKTTDPGTTVEAGKRDNCFQISLPKSYITVQDLKFTKCNYYPFGHNVSGTASNITVQRCTASYGGSGGIFFWQRHATEKTTDILIDGCTVIENGTNGLDISAGINNVTVKNNTVHHNGWSDSVFVAGIHFFSAGDGNNILVEHNTVYEQYDERPDWPFSPGAGVWLDTVGANAVVRYNHVYDNAKTGIFIENTADARVYYNTVHGNGTRTVAGQIDAGIFVYRLKGGVKVYDNTVYNNLVGIALRGENVADRGMVGHIIKNNISVGNTYQNLVATFGAENDGVMGSGNVYLNKCFGVEGRNFIEWGNGVFKDTYATWETAYGGTTNSVEADPLFVNAAGNNFTLQSTSPAIDSGVTSRFNLR